MSIELKITGETADDVKAQMSAFLSGGTFSIVAGEGGVASGGGAAGTGAGAAQTTRRTPPKADPPKVEEVAAEAPVAEEPAAEPAIEEPAADDAPKALTYDGDIKPAVLKVSGKHGRAGVEKLLGEFGVDHTSKVPEDKWPEFLAAIDKALAA